MLATGASSLPAFQGLVPVRVEADAGSLRVVDRPCCCPAPAVVVWLCSSTHPSFRLLPQRTAVTTQADDGAIVIKISTPALYRAFEAA